MIRRCNDDDFDVIFEIINLAALVYKGAIPKECWHEPYMSRTDLRGEIEAGVVFWGYEQSNELVGVMGIQDIQDVTLIRHAYIHPDHQGQGIGGKLLSALRQGTIRPILVGTWADAIWAIQFYEKNDFRLVSAEEKDRLLRRYWSIPDRQIENSVVLADQKWFSYPSHKGSVR
jgi:GNAT superfamily N-acetyltransferase